MAYLFEHLKRNLLSEANFFISRKFVYNLKQNLLSEAHINRLYSRIVDIINAFFSELTSEHEFFQSQGDE